MKMIYLPSATKGMDDYFAAGHSVDEFMELATSELRQPPSDDNDNESASRYIERNGGLIYLKPTINDVVAVPLTNFTARIVKDVIKDDGVEQKREYEVQATCGGLSKRLSVPADAFPLLHWVNQHLGARAIVYPGQSVKDHVRVAIQERSGDLPETEIYVHTGWLARPDGSAVYLHGGGAIGAAGGRSENEASIEGEANSENENDARVCLENGLEHFLLPSPGDVETRRFAVRTCLRLLQIGSPELGFVMLAVAFRAVLGNIDFSLFLVGPSGVFKSELAALIQQFYGAGFNSRNLPGSWSSTDNALEGLAFLLKDAVFVIDDFAAHGSSLDVQRLNAKADRVIRGQGNGAGRARMNADGTLRPTKRSRSLIVATGEDKPNGHSLRARTCFVEIAPGEIAPDQLAICQKDGADGVYAQANAGFCQWLAPQYHAIRASMAETINGLRAKASGRHNRTPEITANLMFGWNTFVNFALDAGAIDMEAAASLTAKAEAAFRSLAARQAAYQAASDPVQRYIDLLAAAIASGSAHIANVHGEAPPLSAACGWRTVTIGSGENVTYDERAQGPKVGWIDGEHLYLSADAAYQAVKRMGGNNGDGVVLSMATMNKRLHERGLLQSVEENREVLTVRRTIEGRRIDVLHLAANCIIYVKPDQPDPNRKQVNDAGYFDAPPAFTEAPGWVDEPLFNEDPLPVGGRVGRVS